jgi:hypothetical protein
LRALHHAVIGDKVDELGGVAFQKRVVESLDHLGGIAKCHRSLLSVAALHAATVPDERCRVDYLACNALVPLPRR